jgi:adenylosuccinate synthase
MRRDDPECTVGGMLEGICIGWGGMIRNVSHAIYETLDAGGSVIVEGNQGFGLSLLHGEYPYCTSRDVTAAAFASECGIAPRDVDDVIVVVRTFPIRVGNAPGSTSGPLKNEIDWERVAVLGGWTDQYGKPETQPEFTSVTKRLRRVAEFDMDMVKQACRVNGATGLAVMGLDRLHKQNKGAMDRAGLEGKGRRFLMELEEQTGVPVRFIGTSPASIFGA